MQCLVSSHWVYFSSPGMAHISQLRSCEGYHLLDTGMPHPHASGNPSPFHVILGSLVGTTLVTLAVRVMSASGPSSALWTSSAISHLVPATAVPSVTSFVPASSAVSAARSWDHAVAGSASLTPEQNSMALSSVPVRIPDEVMPIRPPVAALLGVVAATFTLALLAVRRVFSRDTVAIYPLSSVVHDRSYHVMMGKRSRFEDILDLEDELSWRTEKEPNNRADGDSDNDEDTVVVEEPVVVKSSKKNKKPLVSEEPEKRQRERGDASSRMNMLGGNQPAFVSCKLQDVMLNFGSQQVLKNASWEVKTGDRVGLVGANGGGKSSQLKMLIGDIEASAGEIVKQPSSLKLAFLRQEFYDELDLDRTLKEELMSVFTEETKLMEELAEVEKEIETTMDDVDKMQEVIERVTDLQVKAEKMGVSLLDSKVEKCIDMMGFAVEDSGLPVSAFSGGWKMRIGLGKILLQEPNILLLDEPTNHLDLETVGWLENFLKEQVSLLRQFVSSVIIDNIWTKFYQEHGKFSQEFFWGRVLCGHQDSCFTFAS